MKYYVLWHACCYTLGKPFGFNLSINTPLLEYTL